MAVSMITWRRFSPLPTRKVACTSLEKMLYDNALLRDSTFNSFS